VRPETAGWLDLFHDPEEGRELLQVGFSMEE
jgi:hypothetical protein